MRANQQTTKSWGGGGGDCSGQFCAAGRMMPACNQFLSRASHWRNCHFCIVWCVMTPVIDAGWIFSPESRWWNGHLCVVWFVMTPVIDVTVFKLPRHGGKTVTSALYFCMTPVIWCGMIFYPRITVVKRSVLVCMICRMPMINAGWFPGFTVVKQSLLLCTWYGFMTPVINARWFFPPASRWWNGRFWFVWFVCVNDWCGLSFFSTSWWRNGHIGFVWFLWRPWLMLSSPASRL